MFILGTRNLLVEGGDKISKNLIKNRFIDTFYLFQSPKILKMNKKNQGFTSFGILNNKYKKSRSNDLSVKFHQRVNIFLERKKHEVTNATLNSYKNGLKHLSKILDGRFASVKI